MKKVLLILGVSALFAMAEDLQKDEIKTQADSAQSVLTNKKKSVYQPMEVTSNSYGAFRVGYAYQYQNGGNIVNQSTGQVIAHKEHDSSVYFGLERGWVGLKNNILMAGGYLDGAAGQTFFLSVGARVSLRLLNGWLIPHASFGYQIEHLGFPKDSKQYNMHGGVGTLGLFVNIAQGFGIDLEVRAGTPFYILKPSDAKKFDNPTINHVGFMVNFSFYDFSI